MGHGQQFALGTYHLTYRVYGFLFRSKHFFRKTRVRIYYFCCANFFPEYNIRLYDKNSESAYFFFPPPKLEYFFQQHWESEYYFRKKTYPPPLQVKWSFPYTVLQYHLSFPY